MMAEQTQTQFFKIPLDEITNKGKWTKEEQSSQKSDQKNERTQNQSGANQQNRSQVSELRHIKLDPINKNNTQLDSVQKPLDKKNPSSEKKNDTKKWGVHQGKVKDLDQSHEHVLSDSKKSKNKYHFALQKEVQAKQFNGNLKQFLSEKLSARETVKVKISRKVNLFKNCIFTLIENNESKPLEIEFEKQFKLLGTKTIIKQTSAHGIDENTNQSQVSKLQIGYIQSNFDGSIFNVYRNQPFDKGASLIATFAYQSSLCSVGGPRKVSIYVKTSGDKSVPYQNSTNLKQQYEKQNPGVILYHSLEPEFDEDKGKYSLNFKTQKAPHPSIHNNMFVSQSQGVARIDYKIGLKFYKTNDKEYLLEMFENIEPLVGLAFSFSSFVFKLATQ